MTFDTPIRVILIDDHRHVHEIVATVLAAANDIELVAQGSNGGEAIRLCEEFHPDLILMDVVMPGVDGVAATRTIREKFPDVRILVLSSFQDDESVRSMLESGASGYVLKGELTSGLINTIRATYQGEAVFSAEVAEHLLHPDQAVAPQRFHLSDREMEVLRLMGKGLNNNQIAHELTISQTTVKFHIANILDKLGVETRAEALVAAAKNRLI